VNTEQNNEKEENEKTIGRTSPSSTSTSIWA